MQTEKKGNRIAVLIPCYNEALTIGKVVRDYRQALPEYREAAVEAAQDADLPAYARQWVETYFNALAQ